MLRGGRLRPPPLPFRVLPPARWGECSVVMVMLGVGWLVSYRGLPFGVPSGGTSRPLTMVDISGRDRSQNRICRSEPAEIMKPYRVLPLPSSTTSNPTASAQIPFRSPPPTAELGMPFGPSPPDGEVANRLSIPSGRSSSTRQAAYCWESVCRPARGLTVAAELRRC